MEQYQQRVVAERDEAYVRLEKLGNFIDSPAFAAVEKEEQHRMIEQRCIMEMYVRILGERVAYFKGE